MTSSSTAEAVRLVTERIRHRWAAIGTRLAAELYDCVVLEAGIEDVTGNQTRFAWLARGWRRARRPRCDPRSRRRVEDGDRLLGRRHRVPGLARQLPLGARVSRREPDSNRVASVCEPASVNTCSSPTSTAVTATLRCSTRSPGCAAASMSCGRSARSRRHQRAPALHELAALIGRHRPGEQEALPDVTALGLEPRQLRLILDALGDRLDLQ